MTAGVKNVEHADSAVMYVIAVTDALPVQLFVKDVVRNAPTVQMKISVEDVITALIVSVEKIYSAVTVTPAISVLIMSVPVETDALLVP